MMMGTVPNVDVAAVSDIGLQRSNNEDSYGYDSQVGIFVVCDGMGGVAAGEVASGIAVEQMLRVYRALCSQVMGAEQRLHAAVAGTNEIVWTMSQNHRQLRGMGTTMVAACITGTSVVVGNVGDSRAYFLRDGGCVQITQDHSWADLEVAPQATAFGRQYITRAVGVAISARPDFYTAELRPGDIMLLATDGVTRYADTQELALSVRKHEDLGEACRELVALAHRAGAEDNITCLLLRVR